MESSLENSFVFMQDAGQSTSSLESENHIQSLNQQSKKDLTTNNGKASFVLDDSYIHLNDASENSSITDPSSRSFVVLGKSSMDVIQPSCLASYVDIEQKSMSIDCNSVIASWNSNEVHDKLNELIRENEKLKETLKQNNMAMKQQFNSVASWQEEIMKIHQNHKKKFAETRELMECLKKENAELKSKITGGNDSLESAYEMPSINEMQSSKEKKSSISEVEFQESSLGDNSQLKYKMPSFAAEKLVSMSNLMSSQLKQAISTIQEQSLAIKELKAQHAMSKSYNSNDLEQSIAHNTPEHAKAVDKCASCEQSLKVLKNSLKEVDFILEHRLQHTTAPVHVESPISFNKHSQPTIQQIQQWISKEIKACSMTKHTSELHTEDPQPRKSLDNCQKSQSLESSSPSNHGNLETQELENYFHRLHQSLKQCISKLYEIGVVPKEEIEEDIKKADVLTESLIDVTESIEKNVGDKHLQEQLSDLIKKTKNIEEEKQKIECRRENLEMEFMKLSAEKKKCEETINQLVTEVGTLHETIQKQESEIDKYQTKLRNHEESVNILQEQITTYEKDFKLEHGQKMILSEENSKLQDELQSQIEIIQDLLSQITVLQLSHGNTCSSDA
ncbi:uncharacterized protein LOC117223225 [Megalopta genalis]|uniref:uncharacterized protein LOC117223225 n=1 Tax=Megalopta genalis TaxID=115081 RepID=UPI003FD066EF